MQNAQYTCFVIHYTKYLNPPLYNFFCVNIPPGKHFHKIVKYPFFSPIMIYFFNKDFFLKLFWDHSKRPLIQYNICIWTLPHQKTFECRIEKYIFHAWSFVLWASAFWKFKSISLHSLNNPPRESVEYDIVKYPSPTINFKFKDIFLIFCELSVLKISWIWSLPEQLIFKNSNWPFYILLMSLPQTLLEYIELWKIGLYLP